MRPRFVLTVLCGVATAKADLSFLTVGDWGAGPASGPYAGPDADFSATAAAVAKKMGVVASTMSPGLDFVLNVGDNFYDDGIQNRSDPIFGVYFTQQFTHPALVKAPWYGALGNHDYNGDITAQFNRQSDDPRWYLPSSNYSLELSIDAHTKATLVVLDTNPFIKAYFECPSSDNMAAQLDDPDAWKSQITWLDQVLSASPNAWKIVMGHHTIFSSNAKHCYSELQSSIQPLLEQHHVAAYFNGHYHDLEIHNNNEIDYFTSGAGSQVDWSDFQPSHARKLLCKAPSTAGQFSQNPLYTPDTLPGAQNGEKLPGFMVSKLTPTHMTTDVWTYFNSSWFIGYTRITPVPSSNTKSSSTSSSPLTPHHKRNKKHKKHHDKRHNKH